MMFAQLYAMKWQNSLLNCVYASTVDNWSMMIDLYVYYIQICDIL